MRTNIFFTANREKEEQVLKEFIHVQNRVFPLKEWLGFESKNRLVCEPWDWLVMLQWLQDHGLVKSKPYRPPFKAFECWLRENEMPEIKIHCSTHELSLAHRHIHGARYPWLEVQRDRGLINRWRILYDDLTKLIPEQVDTFQN